MNYNAPYYKAAHYILVNKHGFAEQEATEFIHSSDRAELESKIMAHGGVFDAAYYIGKQLGLSDKDATKFTREALGFENETKITDLLKQGVEAMNKMGETIATPLLNAMVLEACDEIHAGWGKRNESSFFAQSALLNKQHKFLPIAFSGTKGFEDTLIFAKPIAESVNIDIDKELLIKNFQNKAANYLENIQDKGGFGLEGIGEQGIDTIVEIIEALDVMGELDKLSPEIKNALKYDVSFITAIADEINHNGIGSDETLMTMLQDRGIINRDDPSGLDREC